MRTGDEGSQTRYRFPRPARVRTRAQFDQVFSHGRRVGTPLLTLHWLQDGQPPRLGLAVSRRAAPRATTRNRIKRVLRECFRHLRPGLAPGAYVVVARSGAATATTAGIAGAFRDACRRAGALPGQPAGGTMPAPFPPSPPDTPRDRGE